MKGVVFDFGFSQDDARSEKQFLQISETDRVLCLGSGGEVPIELLAGHKGARIDVVDINQNQLFLAQFKFRAAIHLNPHDAAQLIGYTDGSASKRKELYRHLEPHLTEAENQFWKLNQELFERGPIHAGRFETYIRKYNKLVTGLLRKKHLYALMEIEDRDGREAYFDQNIRTRILKMIFKIAFHPRIYKNRGVIEEGLQHSRTSNMAEFFFSRFRNFCVSNLPAHNAHYQFTFFNRILYPAGLPDFLQENELNILRSQDQNLNFFNKDIRDHLKQIDDNYYSKFALSNLSDWLSFEEMTEVMQIILEKSKPGTRILARYIHAPIILTGKLSNRFRVDYDEARRLENMERYPFYSLVPMVVV